MPVTIAQPLQVNSSFTASQNDDVSRYETFHTPAASRRTISRAARSCSSGVSWVICGAGAMRRRGASLLIGRVFLGGNGWSAEIVASNPRYSRERAPRPCVVVLAGAGPRILAFQSD